MAASKHGMGLAVLLLLAALVPSWALTGWCFATMWGWYLIPLGMPTLGAWHAFGVVCTVGMLTGVHTQAKTDAQKEADDAESASEFFARMFGLMLRPVFVVVIGYLAGWIGGIL